MLGSWRVGGTRLAARRGMRISFDRGTVVIDRARSAIDPESLPGVTYDPRVHVWRARADAYAAIRVRLSDEGVRFSDEIRPDAVRAIGPVPALRWYQRDALAAWGGAKQRGVVALPTGAGKTAIAIAAIARLEVATLCLVPTRVLLEQWAAALAAVFGRVGRLGDGTYDPAPLTVATYASAARWAPRIGDRFGLVVVDEAHHLGAECPVEILEMLVAPARLGLTATPPEGDGAEVLALHVGDVVYELGVADLVGDGLAEYDHVMVPISLTAGERDLYRELRGRFSPVYRAFERATPGARWQEFLSAASRTKHGRAAVAAWRSSHAMLAYPAGKRAALRDLLARHCDVRTIVFTANNATAYAIARELLVMPITCEIGRRERALALARFRSGDAPVLVSSQVLDEGFDVPDAEVAIVVGGSGSTRRHIQRIGRVLRPRAGKRARVYELTVAATVETRQAQQRQRGLHEEHVS